MEQKNSPEKVNKFFSEEDIEFLKKINANTSELVDALNSNDTIADKDYFKKEENVGFKKSK